MVWGPLLSFCEEMHNGLDYRYCMDEQLLRKHLLSETSEQKGGGKMVTTIMMFTLPPFALFCLWDEMTKRPRH